MANFREGLHLIPPHMHDAVAQWIEHAEPHPDEMGGFFYHVLCNDLQESASRADAANLRALGGWALFMWNFMPETSWRTRERLLDWYKRHHDTAEASNAG